MRASTKVISSQMRLNGNILHENDRKVSTLLGGIGIYLQPERKQILTNVDDIT